eukprot:TRINITY_DN103382_c0_g1_i1.p1 TRINITY_DN103382_c0_g1~~TRINITY_DN103382_c0_g1_i1.p1  ORF type:complete len:519 (+),score=56.83 TRINITY_DN103382_c0_g1_i1:109-1665(+)
MSYTLQRGLRATLLLAHRLTLGFDASSTCLVQIGTRYEQPETPTCAPLKNQGTYFTVEVCVGTPGQCFDVVADTGSDSVIVPSCVCDKTPGSGCAEDDKCFRGTNKSSTFKPKAHMPMVSITFGSGTIDAALATDVVEVAGIKKNMEDGVLLMVSRAALKIKGDFQGILGLGVPKTAAATTLLQQTPVIIPSPSGSTHVSPIFRDIVCEMFPEICGEGRRSPSDPWEHVPMSPHRRPRDESSVHASKLFLQEAKVDRFSMCFRDSNNSGALRVNLPSFKKTIANVGTLHWGIDFQGLSIGPHGETAPAETLFCGPETMRKGMDTPCGIIPDSGTTLIMGPEEQVLLLEQSLCSKWPRCNQRAQGTPSSDLFRLLLMNCSDWLSEGVGLHEIPSVFFHVKDADGTKSSFELTSWAWVTENTLVGAGEHRKVCTSAFGPMQYVTEKNGPIWIFGTPLFYEYNVGYDLGSKQISLEQGKCEPCDTEVGARLSLAEDRTRYRWPRAMHGKPRPPHIDVNLPF